MPRPVILERSVLHAGYLTVEQLKVKMADGPVVYREIEHHGDAAVVLPYDSDQRCALIAQLFRAPVLLAAGDGMSDEACAGMIECEQACTAARREAYEELGVALRGLEFVARVWASPGVSTERQSLFLAPYRPGDRTGKGGGVAGEHEGVTVVERPLADLAARADAGRITDAKLLILVQTLRLRRPDLFPSEPPETAAPADRRAHCATAH